MTSSGLVKRVIAAVVVGVTGLTMLLYALEQTSLHAFAAHDAGSQSRPPVGVYLTLFMGLVAVSVSACWILQQWSAYVRQHPDVKHLPGWFLLSLIVLPGVGLVYSMATHASYIRGLDQLPLEPNLGFIAFQVVMAALMITALVLLTVRWSPGYYRAQPRSAPAPLR